MNSTDNVTGSTEPLPPTPCNCATRTMSSLPTDIHAHDHPYRTLLIHWISHASLFSNFDYGRRSHLSGSTPFPMALNSWYVVHALHRTRPSLSSKKLPEDILIWVLLPSVVRLKISFFCSIFIYFLSRSKTRPLQPCYCVLIS